MHPPNIIRFGRAICGDLDQAERREWWLANGLGGFAAGTIAGGPDPGLSGVPVGAGGAAARATAGLGQGRCGACRWRSELAALQQSLERRRYWAGRLRPY